MKKAIHLLPCLAALILSSCGGDSAVTESESTESSVDGVFVDAPPQDAISVMTAREKAKPGEKLTVSGKVAGVMNPFTEGFASLVLADEKLETCDLIPGDECVTPWDACCVAPEVIKAQRMTIQIVDENGIPVAESLKGVNDLKELDVLVVTGTVNEASTAENLILDVSGLYQN